MHLTGDCCSCDVTSVIRCPSILHRGNHLLIYPLDVSSVSVQDGAEKLWWLS